MATPQTPRDQFIDQMTRKLLVEWCDQEIRGLPILPGARARLNAEIDLQSNPEEGEALREKVTQNTIRLETFQKHYGPIHGSPSLYIEHAKTKGWLSKDGTKILAAGYQTAARFLKR